MSLDPQVAAFLDACRRSPGLALWETPVAESRAAVSAVPGPPEPMQSVRDAAFPGAAGPVAVRIYEPAPQVSGTCLFFHGGGWVTGNLDTHDALARRIAREAAARVVAVDYRLAPEHQFPAAAEDAHAAALWAAAQFGGPLAVCGDSAGGNLAAAACLMARDRGGPAIAAQALVYPITDCGCDTASYRLFADGYFLTAESMRWFWRQYAPDPQQAAHPYVSTLRAPSLAGLPPALILTAEFDVLRDEGRAYAERLAGEGVPVEYHECPGMIHAFIRRLHEFDRAGVACARIGDFLRREFAARRLALESAAGTSQRS